MIRSEVNMRRIKDVQDVNNENNDRAGFYLSFWSDVVKINLFAT